MLKFYFTVLFALFLFQISNAQAPVINSFNPASGPVGTVVTITGNNFNATAGNNIVFFGGVKATVSSASATSLQVAAPVGATYQPISVLNITTGLQGYSSAPFMTTFYESNQKDFTAQSFSTATITGSSGGIIVFLQLVDIDGDGKLDLTILNTFNQTIDIYRNTSTKGTLTSGSFTLSTTINVRNPGLTYTPYDIKFADLDGDGKLDLVVPYADQSLIAVYKNTSVQGVINSQSFATEVDLGTNSVPYAVTIADLNGDGKPEIIAADHSASSISVFKNVSSKGILNSSSFSAKQDFTIGTGPSSIQAGDLNGDGKIDLIVGDDAGFSVLQNNTVSGQSFSFTTADVTSPIGGSHRAFIGDLDGDGKKDVAVLSTLQKGVAIFKNATSSAGSTISFAAPVTLTTQGKLSSLAIADINGDAKPDLILAPYSDDYSVIPNTSSGSLSFGTEIQFPINLNDLSAVAVGDIDGDGKNDILGSDTYGAITLFHNDIVGLPVISSFAPAAATPGQTVTITGKNFTGTKSVSFGGTNATSFTVVSATSITAVVGNGTTGNILIMTADGPGTISGFTCIKPAIATSGALSALGTTEGTASSSTNFTVSGVYMTAGILVTPPPGYEVSLDNSTFTNTVTVGTTGTIASTTVYVRLASTTAVGTYSGNVLLTSTGATDVNIATISSTVAASTLPKITAGTVNGNISGCVGTASSNPNILQFIVSGVNLTTNVTATAPTGFEVSLAFNSGYGNSVILNQTAGKISGTVVYVRAATSASAGTLTGNVVLASSGATNQNVPVKGTITALPGGNAISNQTLMNGAATTAINFTGSANTFNWVNDSPGIGLPASGTGNIASFSAVNNTPNPITATITAIPATAGFAYVADLNSYLVSVINIASNQVIGRIDAGNSPKAVSVSPDGSRVYVGNTADNTITVINAATNGIITTIQDNGGIGGIAVGADGTKVYVANLASNTVSVINASTNSLITRINVGTFPYGIAVSPDGSKVYVCNSSSNNVSVISTATNTVIANIAVGSNPSCIAVSPDGRRIYVTNGGSNTVSVVNTATNTVITNVAVGNIPVGVAITPDGSSAYIANQGTNSVSLINTITNTVTATIALPNSGPQGVSVSPDGRSVYITTMLSGNSGLNNLFVISTATNTVTNSISAAGNLNTFGNFIAGGSICTGAPITFTITVNPTKPVITTTGTLSALSTTPGTASASTAFTVSGSNLASGILITPPTGFEVSTDNVTFNNAVTVGGIGTLTATTIYVRLAATASAGTYSGNVVLSGTNATSANVTTIKSIISGSPVIIGGPVAGNIFACPGTVSESPNIQQFSVSGSGLTSSVSVGAPTGFEVSLSLANGYGSTVTLVGSGGILSSTLVFVRASANASSGNISGNVVLTSQGATSQNVGVNGVIYTLPGANPVANQTVANGSATTDINFTGTANSYTWNNNLPGIGIPSSGGGNIKSFKAINTGINPIKATITVTPGPYMGLAYVANSSTNTVSAFDIATNTVVTKIPVGINPIGTCLSNDNSVVYVANHNSNTISVINAITNTVSSTIPVSGGPLNLAISKDGSRLYATTTFNSGSVSVINTVTNTEIATVRVGSGPQGIIISLDGNFIYVANNGLGANSVSVINTATNTVISTIGVEITPWALTLSPDGSKLYVTNGGFHSVSVINTATNAVVSSLETKGYPTGIAISKDGSLAYVSNIEQGKVMVINTATGSIVAQISVGPYPYGISLSPDGSNAYVIDRDANSISVINTTNNTVTNTIALSSGNIGSGNFIAANTGCSGAPVTFTITVNPSPPSISTSGTLAALSGTFGTASSSTSFNVSGTNLAVGIVIMAPQGFEVSSDNVNFTKTITIGTGGTIASTPVYIRLTAANPVGSYSGNIILTSTGAANINLAVANSVVTLPANNFKLTITSATCKGTSDGSVNIAAEQNLGYTATITGNGLNTPYPFTSSTNIINLAPGAYSVCITVDGQPDYEQCYDVVISEPKDLSIYSTVNDADKTISLSLNGASQYNIQLNNSTYTTTDNSITLPLTAGNNNLVVTTDKLCQGTVQKLINVSGMITPYPIPFQDVLNLNIGNKNVETVLVEIHSLEDGRLVYSKTYNNQSGVLQLDVSKFKIGPYALHLSLNNSQTIYKISKQ